MLLSFLACSLSKEISCCMRNHYVLCNNYPSKLIGIKHAQIYWYTICIYNIHKSCHCNIYHNIKYKYDISFIQHDIYMPPPYNVYIKMQTQTPNKGLKNTSHMSLVNRSVTTWLLDICFKATCLLCNYISNIVILSIYVLRLSMVFSFFHIGRCNYAITMNNNR